MAYVMLLGAWLALSCPVAWWLGRKLREAGEALEVAQTELADAQTEAEGWRAMARIAVRAHHPRPRRAPLIHDYPLDEGAALESVPWCPDWFRVRRDGRAPN